MKNSGYFNMTYTYKKKYNCKKTKLSNTQTIIKFKIYY